MNPGWLQKLESVTDEKRRAFQPPHSVFPARPPRRQSKALSCVRKSGWVGGQPRGGHLGGVSGDRCLQRLVFRSPCSFGPCNSGQALALPLKAELGETLPALASYASFSPLLSAPGSTGPSFSSQQKPATPFLEAAAGSRVHLLYDLRQRVAAPFSRGTQTTHSKAAAHQEYIYVY